ncbi:MAG: prolipoprotein diacylglyceryl transferase [Desulfobacteraceae bacterium]|nr:prolipoprotein diacylglyceryl transferase [Desulfobacteraceae bacterium]
MTNSFLTYWQHIPEKMSPVFISLGPLKIHYYGLMYIIAFGLTYALIIYRVRHEDRFTISSETVQGLMTAMILGLLIGARLGYVVFYNFSYYLGHPLEIIIPFDFSNGMRFTGITGMSYHGGLIGVIIGALIFLKRNGLGFMEMSDLVIPAIPLGYTFGRLGNFINGELYGRTTDAVYGMYFPAAQDGILRHPSQLYEAFFEGIFLFAILWAIRKRVRLSGAMLSIYLAGYGLVRFFIEYAREPDDHLGLVAGPFSMGQLLCAGMMLAALGWYGVVHQLNKTKQNE